MMQASTVYGVVEKTGGGGGVVVIAAAAAVFWHLLYTLRASRDLDPQDPSLFLSWTVMPLARETARPVSKSRTSFSCCCPAGG